MSNSRLHFLAGLAIVAAACSRDPNVVKQRYLALGNTAFDKKQYAEAIIQYKNALQRDQRFPEARYKLAQAYDQLGDGPNAMREYIRAADLLPGDAVAQVRAGLFLAAAGQFDDAKVRALTALQINPRQVE